MTKQETLQKGVGVAKFDFTKAFRNQLFSRVRVLYHQYLITNHSESIFKDNVIHNLAWWLKSAGALNFALSQEQCPISL